MRDKKKSLVVYQKIKIFLIVMMLVLSLNLLIYNVSATEPEFINIKIQSSTDQMNWYDVDGTLNTGFNLKLNESATYNYLDIKYASTNVDLKQGFHGFRMDTYPLDLFDYWEEKGVDSSSPPGSWQEHMWNIINGDLPIFYIYVDSNQNLDLIDGLNRDFFGDNTALLRVNGDYPQGDYTFSGNLTSFDDDVSLVDLKITFIDNIENMLKPRLKRVDLKQSTDRTIWNETYGSLYSLYCIPIDSSNLYYVIDIEDAEYYGELETGYYGFYINNYPSGFFSYWNSEGVNTGSTPGTWQAHMWKIINGDAPRFYIYVNENKDISFVDGLNKDFYGLEDFELKLNGNIPQGFYSYNGKITNTDGIDSENYEFFFSFVDQSNYRIWVDDNYDSFTPGWGIDHFNNIKDGINQCIEGGLLYVQPGTYEEVFEIDKPIIIKSKWGAFSTTITDENVKYSDLLDTSGQTVKINSSHVLLEDFTIQRFEMLFAENTVGNIGSDPVSYVDVRDCTIESFFDTMIFRDVSYLSIYDNTFTCQNDDIAIYLENIDNFMMVDDDLESYNYHAAYVKNSDKGFIDNLAINTKRIRGLFFDNCNNIYVTSTVFYNCEQEAFFVNNSENISIDNSIFTNNNLGICLGNDSIVKIKDNSYSNNSFDIYHAVYLNNYNTHYSNIQKAIDLAEPKMDVNIYPGNYTENIVVNKSLDIHGLEDKEEVIIYGNSNTPAFLIAPDSEVNDFFIEDLTITGGNHSLKTGIYQDVSGLIVSDCIIRNPQKGYAVYIDPHNFSDESSARPGTDIFEDAVDFSYCKITGGFYYQYWPYEVYTATIDNQLVLRYNEIDNMFLNGSVSVLIKNNIIGSLGMMYSRDIEISDNTFENPWETLYGIYLWSINGTPDVGNIIITDNTILEYDRLGILIAGAYDVTITKNDIRACLEDGIRATEDYINIYGERCIGNIYNLIVENNDFTLCGSGVKLTENIDGADIINNNFDRNQEAIRLHQSGYNDIYDNTFLDNYIGLRIDQGSTNNLIYNNYFENIVNAEDDSTEANTWNVTKQSGTNIMGGPYLGGNYWSDYTGEDTDGDSLGDTLLPYTGSGKILNGGDYLPIILTDLTPPTVQVTYPKGGESVNGTITVTWSASDDFDSELDIDILYSNDSGITWNMIAPNEENDGEYDWDLSALSEGTKYLVKIIATDNAGLSSNDTSDSVFTIYREFPNPVVTIVKPMIGYFYLFDSQWMRFLANNCFIISDITIEAEVDSPLDISKVEFYIDNQKVNTTSTKIYGKYSWEWDERVLFYHDIKVIAYDIHGKTGESEVGVTIFNPGIIP